MSLHYMKLFKTGKLKNETIVDLFDFHHIQLKVNQKLVYFILFVVLLSLIILRAYSTAIAVCLKFIQRLPFFFSCRYNARNRCTQIQQEKKDGESFKLVH